MQEEKIDIVFLGTFNKSEILSGPEKVCKRIFEEYSKNHNSLFIDYFQDGRLFGLKKKLFGYELIAKVYKGEVVKLGIIRMLYDMVKLKPKIIHILCFERFGVFIYLLKLFLNIKIFYNVNGIIRHENKYYNEYHAITVIKNIIVENVFVYLSDRIFYLSELSKSILSLYYSVNSTKLFKVINGLDDYFAYQNKLQNTTKISHSIVFIGNISRKEKGLSFLLNSLSCIDINIKLYIITENIDKAKLPISRNSNIILVNKMIPQDMIEFFKDKELVVSASEYDPFNISAFEAISCGLFPILTKETGLSEIIKKYCPYPLIDFGDNEALVSKLKNLLNNPKSLNLSDLKVFSWKNIFEKYYLHNYV